MEDLSRSAVTIAGAASFPPIEVAAQGLCSSCAGSRSYNVPTTAFGVVALTSDWAGGTKKFHSSSDMNDLDLEGSQLKDTNDVAEADNGSMEAKRGNQESVWFTSKTNNVSIASTKQNGFQENQKNQEPDLKGAFGSTSTALGLDQLECRKCKMIFRKRDQLANHLEKFCSNSEYADIEQFKMKLLSAEYGSGGLSTNNASFNSVRQLLSGGAVSDVVGKTSLANLRLQINADETSMAEVKSSIRKSREREMIAQLCDMKVEANCK